MLSVSFLLLWSSFLKPGCPFSRRKSLSFLLPLVGMICLICAPKLFLGFSLFSPPHPSSVPPPTQARRNFFALLFFFKDTRVPTSMPTSPPYNCPLISQNFSPRSTTRRGPSTHFPFPWNNGTLRPSSALQWRGFLTPNMFSFCRPLRQRPPPDVEFQA